MRPESEGVYVGDSTAEGQPLSVAAWVRQLWSQVLFPGNDAPSATPTLMGFCIVALLPALLLYGSLSFHLLEPDEGRYAEIPREMLSRGDWTVPHLQGEPYLDKPPLLYWLVALSYSIFGPEDWAARLVPALAIHVCILATYGFGCRLVGRKAALLGALLLAVAPGFTIMGRLLILDGLLSACVAMAVFLLITCLRSPAWDSRGWRIAALFIGLGVLTKGPIAILLCVPPILIVGWLRALSSTPSRRAWLELIGIVALVNFPWYVAIALRLPLFLKHFLWDHNIVRFLAPFDHLRPIWFYIPVVLFGLLPAMLFLPGAIRFLLSSRQGSRLQRGPVLGILLVCGGWCVLFFSLSGCKLPTYVLPAFPFLALAMGQFLVSMGWSTRPLVIGSLIGSYGCLAFAHLFVIPWYAGYRGPLGQIADVRACCADLNVPVVCYPRQCNSVAFYLGRDDLRSYRSKETHLMIQFIQEEPRTVVLLTHRHSLQGLGYALPPHMEIVETKHLGLKPIPGLPAAWSKRLTGWLGDTALGLSDIAIVARKPGVQMAQAVER